MSVYHTANTTTGFRGGWYPGDHLLCHPPPLQGGGGALHWNIRENGPGSTKVPVLILSCQVHPLPGCKVHTQDSSYPWTVWTPQTYLDVIGLRSVAFVPESKYLKFKLWTLKVSFRLTLNGSFVGYVITTIVYYKIWYSSVIMKQP